MALFTTLKRQKSAKTAENYPKNGHRYDTPKEPSFQIRKSQEKSGGVTQEIFFTTRNSKIGLKGGNYSPLSLKIVNFLLVK